MFLYDMHASLIYCHVQGLSAGLLRQATYTTARLGSFRYAYLLQVLVSMLSVPQYLLSDNM